MGFVYTHTHTHSLFRPLRIKYSLLIRKKCACASLSSWAVEMVKDHCGFLWSLLSSLWGRCMWSKLSGPLSFLSLCHPFFYFLFLVFTLYCLFLCADVGRAVCVWSISLSRVAVFKQTVPPPLTRTWPPAAWTTSQTNQRKTRWGDGWEIIFFFSLVNFIIFFSTECYLRG